MKYLLFFLIPTFCLSQNRNNTPLEKSIDKWQKAVIGLETRKFAYENIDSQKTQKTIQEGLKIVKQNIGSAIFLKVDSKRYLITARHVLVDEEMAYQVLKYSPNSNMAQDIDKTIYMNIFRIPLENELKGTSANEPVLGELPLLGAPTYNQRRYVFSTPEIDLAIISLDGGCRFSHFADLLERKGYVPITINDIDTTELTIGKDLYCLGFPVLALERIQSLDANIEPYQSNLVLNIAATFGKISIPKIGTNFFIGDISIGPGNSGGPMISNGKLVGIVSRQSTTAVETDRNEAILGTRTRMPYAISIKTSLIFPLLAEMVNKDKNNPENMCR
jgi:hypothetical protein